MLSLPPKGLLGVLVTPLDDQGNIDARSLESLVNSTLNDVDGFLAGVSFTGEGFLLSNEKKLELIRISLEIVRGRVPLILGITGNSSRETGENISALDCVSGPWGRAKRSVFGAGDTRHRSERCRLA